MRECDGLLSEVWINTVQHSEKLICNIFRRPKDEEGIPIQYFEYSFSQTLKLTNPNINTIYYLLLDCMASKGLHLYHHLRT